MKSKFHRYFSRLSPLKALTAGEFPSTIILMAVLGGVSGTLVMIVLIAASQQVGNGSSSLTVLTLALVFVPVMFLYRWSRRQMMETSLTAVQATLYRTRSRIVRKLARLDLRDIEAISREKILSVLMQACDAISEAILPTVFALQSVVMMVLGFAYLAYLSPIGVVCAVAGMTFVTLVFAAQVDMLQGAMSGTVEAGVLLSTGISEFVSGFKELRLDRNKQTALMVELRGAAMTAARQRARAAGAFTEVMTEASSSEFLVAAAVVFVVPVFSAAQASDLPAVLAAVLFLTAPFSAMANTIPRITSLWFAVNRLIDFEKAIDTLLPAAAEEPATVLNGQVSPASGSKANRIKLELQAITYEHRAPGQPQGFHVGPLDFRVSSGEIVFITGNNGAGKTTALRLITGLYPPRGGRIFVNDEALTLADIEAYRHLFGTVFADFHVFRKPYGLLGERLDAFRQALDWLEIAGKLPGDLIAGYDPALLSTGQRKRLALAVAVAEDRPVLVFDEWAADQDPEFRAKFYLEILPRFRAAGKAIIAITHDDRYFDVADRRYHMAERRMTLVSGS